MSIVRRHARLLAVGLSCAGLGAGASAIASAGAATHATSSTAAKAAHRSAGARALARAVHVSAVIPGKHGFQTVTLDRGFVQSVSGERLTVREGTRTATYRTVSFTVPSSARVRNAGHPASLSQLTPGERVLVTQGPVRMRVVARPARTH